MPAATGRSPTSRRKVNPAFANAHGLATKKVPSSPSRTKKGGPSSPRSARLQYNKNNTAKKKNDPWESLDQELSSPAQIESKLKHEIAKARSSGRLSLKDVGLTSPLPDAIFDLRSDLNLNGDLDIGNSRKEKAWECYGEEMLISIDISENDLSSTPTTSSSSSSGVAADDEENSKDRPKSQKDRPWTPKKDGVNKRPMSVPANEEMIKKSPTAGMLDERFASYISLRTLRMKRCKLTALPFHIFKEKLVSLMVLDASDNQLTEFRIQDMPETLSALDISHNLILNLATSNEEDNSTRIVLPNLTNLDANNNQLTEVPSDLSTPKLQHLFLGQNCIKGTIPKKFLDSSLESLQTLFAPENQLSSIPDLSFHAQLQVIELRSNDLSIIPSIHDNVYRLGLNYNKIKTIEGLYPILDKHKDGKLLLDNDNVEWFRVNLKELHLQKNDLKMNLHPATTAVMTKLSLLDISHNELEALPPVLGYLQDMNKIIADGNPFRMIRNAINYGQDGKIDMNKLKTSLRHKDLPPPGPGYLAPEKTVYDAASSGTGGAVTSPQKRKEAQNLVRGAIVGTRKLDMSGGGYTGKLNATEILEALSDKKNGSNIVSWDISSNGKLTSIGEEWFEALDSLLAFDAHKNCIDSLPKTLQEVPLQSLMFGRNALSSTQFQLTICSNPQSPLSMHIEHLDLTSNKIEWIPNELFDLPKLKTLNLSYNKITTLEWSQDENTGQETGWRHGLVSLEHLDLSTNKISNLGYLPIVLSACKNLHTLKLANNEIDDIPLELGLLSQLSNIDLLGNPQRRISVGMLTKSCKEILKYLKNKMDPSDVTRVLEEHREIEATLLEEKEEKESKTNASKQTTNQVQTTTSSSGPTLETSDSSKTLSPKMSELTEKFDTISKERSELESRLGSSISSAGSSTPEGTKQHQQPGTPSSLSSSSSPKAAMKQRQQPGTPSSLSSSSQQSSVQRKPATPTSEQKIEELNQKIESLVQELNNLSLSQAKRFALKKSLAMRRSELIREKRKMNETM